METWLGVSPPDSARQGTIQVAHNESHTDSDALAGVAEHVDAIHVPLVYTPDVSQLTPLAPSSMSPAEAATYGAVPNKESGDHRTTFSLMAFPAKDNYEGLLYPLEWISKVRDTVLALLKSTILGAEVQFGTWFRTC
jgi:hypothetical protein